VIKQDEPVWETIATAPYDRDLELAVVEGNRVHSLVFACRRVANGWVKVPTREHITVSPTHWRLWQKGEH
jgi:hypothetical protein